MKHLTYSDKKLVVGDEAADVLISYATMLANRGDADAVRFATLRDDDVVMVTVLLSTGAPLMAEPSHNDRPEPDNSIVVDYMRERLLRRGSPLPVLPLDVTMATNAAALNAALDRDLELG
jgi:hypothetical protein